MSNIPFADYEWSMYHRFDSKLSASDIRVKSASNRLLITGYMIASLFTAIMVSSSIKVNSEWTIEDYPSYNFLKGRNSSFQWSSIMIIVNDHLPFRFEATMMRRDPTERMKTFGDLLRHKHRLNPICPPKNFLTDVLEVWHVLSKHIRFPK